MHILLTGGGTGGHVVPNVALIEEMLKKKSSYAISYLGQKNSIEERLIDIANKNLNAQVYFYRVPAGKLRRYFSIRNFIDFFKVIAGFFKSLYLIIKIKPDVVFCKGGYVSLPVGVAAFLLGKKLIIHESDLSPGLTTKILYRLAGKVCLGFEETLKKFPKNTDKFIFTGNPVRASVLEGSESKALEITGFKEKNLPTILIIGGSSGALALNQLVSEILPELTKICRVVHITGKNTSDEEISITSNNYKKFEYLNEELPHIFKITDLVISRAGANSIAEFIKLNLPNILVPLPILGSRGDQIENAKNLEKRGAGKVLNQENLSPPELLSEIKKILNDKKLLKSQKEALKKYSSEIGNSTQKILKVLGL